jgi:alpha-methylacyl-CoA racemase
MSSAPRPKPLAGVRVLDLTRLLPGPMATLHLADLGADVVKVEDTGAGDYARAMGHVREGMSDFFRVLNRNKRAIRLDLKRPGGRDAFLKLAEGAAVVVEGFRPGVMAKLGLGYETLAALNPRVVVCSITGYGQDGPYRDRAGHDINYMGYAGVGNEIGAEGGPPVVPNFQVADLLGGALVPVMGILAALLDARACGRGRHVDVAMSEAVLAHAIFPLLGVLEHGTTPERGTTMLAGGLACYNHYRTRDGRWMAVGALERKFWDTLCDILACPDLKAEHIVYGAPARAAKDRLAAVFATRTQAEWTAVFAHADCCVSPVLPMHEALADEHARAREMVIGGERPAGLAPPMKLSALEFAPGRAAPAPGEHTEEVLREAGYGGPEIEALRKEGVI